MSNSNQKNAKRMEAEITRTLVPGHERIAIWVMEHSKALITALVVVFIIAAIAIGVAVWADRRDAAAANALANAETEEELYSLIARYDGHRTALSARKRLSRMLVAAGKYDEALVQLDKIIAADNALVASSAKLTHAYVCEMKKDDRRAAEEFAAIATDAAESPYVRAEAIFAAGRLYSKLGNTDLAAEILSKASGAGNSQAVEVWNSRSRMLLLMIEADKKTSSAPAK
ncbi:MAG: hypothetical protein PHI35_05960 [Victivallaceae bacterium]|nr:hypothetical protein [Victivallaceae bacterium]